ncbi:MAG: hypothetical protein GY711_01195 [bacterium]|nr:hypothetical protein [bacterium]
MTATNEQIEDAGVFRIRAYINAADTIRTMGTPLADRIAAKEHPPGLLDLLKIPGLGPKKVRALMQNLNVTSPATLLEAASAGRLKEVPGFGAKTEERCARRLLGLDETT